MTTKQGLKRQKDNGSRGQLHMPSHPPFQRGSWWEKSQSGGQERVQAGGGSRLEGGRGHGSGCFLACKGWEYLEQGTPCEVGPTAPAQGQQLLLKQTSDALVSSRFCLTVEKVH